LLVYRHMHGALLVGMESDLLGEKWSTGKKGGGRRPVKLGELLIPIVKRESRGFGGGGDRIEKGEVLRIRQLFSFGD